MKNSNEYDKCSCGGGCTFYDLQDEYGKCWGECVAVNEESYLDIDGNYDYYWVHACRGHSEMWDSHDKKLYISEPLES